MLTSHSTLVCFGDSLTAFGTWPDALSTRFGFRCINAGVGGQTAVQGLARFDTDVTPHHPDAVIIGFGTNDQVIYDPSVGPQVSEENYATALRTMIARCRALGAQPFLMTPCVVDSTAYYSRHPKAWCEPYGGVQTLLERYRRIARETAAEADVPVIDIGLLSSTCKDDVLGTPTHPDFDGVHPVDSGKALFERWIGDALTPYIQL